MPPRKRRNLKMENKVPNQVEESEDESSSNEEYESNEDDSSSSEAESESKEDNGGGEEESESKEDDGGAEEEYEVEKIVGKRRKKGKVQYCIKWKGWDDSYNSWQNKKKCYCPELIEEYEKACRGELEEEEYPSKGNFTPGVSKMKERSNSEEHYHSSSVKNNGNYLLFEKSNSDSTCSTKIQKRKLSTGEEHVSKRIRTYSHDFESRGSSPDNKKVHDSKVVNNKHLWALPQNKTIVKPNHEVDHQHFSNIEKKIDFGKIDYFRLDTKTDSSPRLSRTDSSPRFSRTDSSPRFSRTESSDDEAKQSYFFTEAKLDSLCKKMEEDSAFKKAKTNSRKDTKIDSSRQRTKIGSSHYQKARR